MIRVLFFGGLSAIAAAIACCAVDAAESKPEPPRRIAQLQGADPCAPLPLADFPPALTIGETIAMLQAYGYPEMPLLYSIDMQRPVGALVGVVIGGVSYPCLTHAKWPGT